MFRFYLSVLLSTLYLMCSVNVFLIQILYFLFLSAFLECWLTGKWNESRYIYLATKPSLPKEINIIGNKLTNFEHVKNTFHDKKGFHHRRVYCEITHLTEREQDFTWDHDLVVAQSFFQLRLSPLPTYHLIV